MSLLVSPIANLIGSGHAVNEDEFLDFFEIDENTYPRTFIFLKAQKTIFESIQKEISELTVDKEYKDNLEFVTSMTNGLLNSEFGEVFDKAKSAIPSIRDFINNQKNDTPEKIIKISQKLLSSSIALSRVFSIIAYSLPSMSQSQDDSQSVQTNENSQYSPDLQDVLVLCRICEEYVPLSQIEQHSRFCAREHESRFRIISVDERIAKLQKSIKTILLKPVWPGTKDKCINVYLPLFHITMLLEKTLHTRTLSNNDARVLGIILTSLSRIKIRVENQNIDSMFQKSKELINEKLKVCISRVSASPLPITNMDEPPAPHKIEVTIADFEIIKRISSGAYARVFLARKKKTGDIYAMKVVPKSSVMQKNQMQRILNEKDIMLQNENSYIVNFYYSIIGYHNLYLVMEYLPGGDLYSLLQNVGSLSEEHTLVYTCQIVMALQSLHKRGIIHRDIKPDNILITTSGKLKLTDFGLSMIGNNDRRLSEEDACVKNDNESFVGTPDYLPPEIILSQPHTFTADYWSLGAVIYELLAGIPPFHRDTEYETFSAIIIGRIDWEELDEFSDNVKSLIKGLLEPNPEKRLGANGIKEIMDHPWFSGIDWANLDLLDPPFVPEIQDEHSTEYFQERYEFNKTDDRDIIEDIERAQRESKGKNKEKSQRKKENGDNNGNGNENDGHQNENVDDKLKDFASIDFKSLYKTNQEVASKMRAKRKWGFGAAMSDDVGIDEEPFEISNLEEPSSTADSKKKKKSPLVLSSGSLTQTSAPLMKGPF